MSYNQLLTELKTNYTSEKMKIFKSFGYFSDVKEISTLELNSFTEIIGESKVNENHITENTIKELSEFFDNQIISSIDRFSKENERIDEKEFFKICGDVSLEESQAKKEKKIRIQKELKEFFLIYVVNTFIFKAKTELDVKEIEKMFFQNLNEEEYIKKLGLKCKKQSMSKAQPALHNFYNNLSKCCKKFVLTSNKLQNDDFKELIHNNESLSAESALMKMFSKELTTLVKDILSNDKVKSAYLEEELKKLESRYTIKL